MSYKDGHLIRQNKTSKDGCLIREWASLIRQNKTRMSGKRWSSYDTLVYEKTIGDIVMLESMSGHFLVYD